MRAVNLIPTDQRSGASVGAGRSEGAAYAVLALLVVIAGLAVLYGKASRDASSDKTEAATLTRQAQRASSQADALAPYTSFVALREQREQAVASLVDSRFDWAHAIHEFGRVLSGQVMLTSLTGTIGSAGATTTTAAASAAASSGSATPAGSVPTFQIAGCATSQKVVADTIQRLRLIDGVAEVTLQSSTRGSSGAGAAASGSSGGCGAGDPVFQMTVTFEPLPTASATAAAATTATVSDTARSGGGSQ